jgi:hypothetical protein
LADKAWTENWAPVATDEDQPTLKVVTPPEPVLGIEWVTPTAVAVVPASMVFNVPCPGKSFVM